MFYSLSRMEKWIADEYVKYNILSPDNIDIEVLADIYNVIIWKFPMEARYDIFENRKFIVIDSRTSSEIQREQFFHELCHVLFHVGHQSDMNDPFRKLLEWEADNFVLYASLPYFMIKEYDLTSEYIIHELSNDFNVTASLCKKKIRTN